jgi:hypothetical protein
LYQAVRLAGHPVLDFETIVIWALLAGVSVLLQAPPTPRLPWGVGPQGVIPIDVPAEIRSAVSDDLEYDDGEPIKGVTADLDGDSIRDFLLQSAPSLCGNGGCVYVLVDGKTHRKLGEFFGSPLYVYAERTHGHPNIATYNHLSASSATYTEYGFDGSSYVVTSKRTLEGPAADRFTEILRQIPILKP